MQRVERKQSSVVNTLKAVYRVLSDSSNIREETVKHKLVNMESEARAAQKDQRKVTQRGVFMPGVTAGVHVCFQV